MFMLYMISYNDNDNNICRIISDRHYRKEAIEDLKKLYNYLYASCIFTYGDINGAPSFLIKEEDRQKCFEYGVKRVYGEQAMKLLRTAMKEQSVQQQQKLSEQQFSLVKYVEDCCRTECKYEDATYRANEYINLLHGAIGLCTETGELQDAIKKFVFYGKDLDIVNIGEEIGDICWYISIICNCIGLDFEECLKKNIEKLKKRYPEKFTEELADHNNRNFAEERKVLEQ